MSNGKLPEKYRKARNVQEGYEIRVDGTWCPVTSVMHITAPLAVSTFTVTFDGQPWPVNIHPNVEVMSRRLPQEATQ